MTDKQITAAAQPLPAQAPTPADMLQAALASGKTADELGKLMDLYERWQTSQALKAFIHAMAEFQSKCPPILKLKEVRYGNTRYEHATLDQIDQIVTPVLREFGLSKRWEFEDVEGGLRVTCVVTHEEGHSERTSMTVPYDSSGSKNAIQARGSAATYAQRYSLIGALGISTASRDDDGRGGEVAKISEGQAADLQALVEETGTDMAKFLKWAGVKALEALPADRFEAAIAMLERKRRAK